MAILNIVGFEGGSVTVTANQGDTGEINSIAGTVEISTTTVRTGVYSGRTNPTTTDQGRILIGMFGPTGIGGGLAVDDAYTQFYFRYATKPSSGISTIFGSADSGSAGKFYLAIDSSGKLNIYDSTGTQIGSVGATTLSANTWYQIRVRVGTGASANYSVAIDGVSEFSGTANLGLNQNELLSLGRFTKGGIDSNTIDFFFDDIIIDSSTFPSGNVEIKAIKATANGATMSWINGTGASDYTQIDEVPFDDADYVQSPTTGNPNVALFAMENTSTVGISGTILAVKLIARLRENSTASSSSFTRIASGGSNADTTAVNRTTTISQAVKLALVDPATSTAWTTSGVDALEMGAVENNAVATRLTQVLGMVAYIPAVGPTNIKSYNTNVFANIKSIDTNAIANVKSLNTNT